MLTMVDYIIYLWITCPRTALMSIRWHPYTRYRSKAIHKSDCVQTIHRLDQWNTEKYCDEYVCMYISMYMYMENAVNIVLKMVFTIVCLPHTCMAIGGTLSMKGFILQVQISGLKSLGISSYTPQTVKHDTSSQYEAGQLATRITHTCMHSFTHMQTHRHTHVHTIGHNLGLNETIYIDQYSKGIDR